MGAAELHQQIPARSQQCGALKLPGEAENSFHHTSPTPATGQTEGAEGPELVFSGQHIRSLSSLNRGQTLLVRVTRAPLSQRATGRQEGVRFQEQ